MWRLSLSAIFLLFFLTVGIHPPHNRNSNAKRVARTMQIEHFYTALRTYKKDTGRYPTSTEGLQALREPFGVKGWRGPYLAGDIPADPWGSPYEYRLDAQTMPRISGIGAPGPRSNPGD